MTTLFDNLQEKTKALFAANDTANAQKAVADFFYQTRKDIFTPWPETETMPLALTYAKTLATELERAFEQQVPTQKEKTEFAHLRKAFVMTGFVLDQIAATTEEPAYHNRLHNMTVTAMRAVRGHFALKEKKGPSARDYLNELRDLTSALAHDLGHDGTGNTRNSVYEPARLEKVATNIFDVILDAAKVDPDTQDFMCKTIWSTDPLLPGDILHYACKRHFGTPSLAFTRDKLAERIILVDKPVRIFLNELLISLEESKELTESAAALKSADMAPSFSLPIDIWHEQEKELSVERGRQSPTPNFLIGQQKPPPQTGVFVMINFVGNELCAKRAKAWPESLGLMPSYPDPASQKLFGKTLEETYTACLRASGAEGAQIVRAFAQKHQYSLTNG